MFTVNAAGDACPTAEELEAFRQALQTEVRTQAWRQTLRRHGLRRGAYVAIAPDVQNGRPTPRRWSAKGFAGVMAEISRRHVVPLVLLGDGDETPRAQLLDGQRNVLNLVGRTSMSEAIHLIFGAGLLLCHDGGLLFIANALKVPVVTLVGPSALREAQPLAAGTVPVRYAVPCAPCIGPAGDAAALSACASQVACMEGITEAAVLAAAAPALAAVATCFRSEVTTEEAPC